jgi:putative transposase
MLAEIRDAEDRQHAVTAAKAFAAEFGAKWPKAVAKIDDDLEPLLAFYDFPAEYWLHLKTTNPIESTFATVRLRTTVTRAPAPGPPAWPWRSSCSKQPRPAGGP